MIPHFSHHKKDEFVSVWKTDNAGGVSANNQISFPTENSGTYACRVYWGDGSNDYITTWNDPAWTHTYAAIGTYTVYIYGTFEGFRFNNGGDKTKIIAIVNGGNNFRLGNNNAYFYGCSNLLYTNNIITTGMTNFYYMYRDCSNFNGDVPFDTSSVTQMYAMFYNCTNFNKPLHFDTQNVGNMAYMFSGATSFNQPLNQFDISLVTNMTFMLNNATSWSNENYSNALIAWEAGPHQNNVPFKCESKYLAGAAAARAALIVDLWTITDLGAA